MGDFENNRFYTLLKTKFSSEYKAAKKNKCIICVPNKGWGEKTKFNKRFIESHIFKQSPRFLTEYVSVRKDKHLVVQIDDRTVIPVSGFECNEPLQIINEELCYNENYEQFFVYLVDRIIGTPASNDEDQDDICETLRNGRTETVTANNTAYRKTSNSNDSKSVLVGSRSSEETSDDDSYDADLKTPLKTLEWYQSLLQLEPSYEKGVRILTNEVDQFNLSYVFIGGEEDHMRNVSEKMGMIYEKILQILGGMKILETDEDESDLSIAVESCLIDGISAKLYRTVQTQCRTEIHNFSQLCPHFAKLNFSALKINESFNCDLTESAKVLSKLHSVVTPNDILNVLQETIQRICVDVSTHAKLRDPFSGRTVNVSADELVPLVAKVICLSHLEDIEKFLQVAQYFRFAFSTNEGELNYAVTTFIAAKQLIIATFPDFKFDTISETSSVADDGARTESPVRGPKATRFPRASLHFPNLDESPGKANPSLQRFRSTRSHGDIRQAAIHRTNSFYPRRSHGMPTVIDIEPISRGSRSVDATGAHGPSGNGGDNSQAGIFGLLGNNPLWYCSNQSQYSARK